MGGLALTVSCTKEPLFDIPEGAVMLTSENHVSHDKTSVYNTSVQWVGDGSESVTINDNPYTVHVSEGTAYILPGSDDDNPAIPSGSVFGHYGCESVTAPSGTPLTTTVTVPSTYDCSYDGNGRQILALPMVAYSPTLGGTIQFKQVTAAVRVMVRNEFSVTLALDSVVVSSNNYKLSGTVTVGLTNGGNPTVAPQAGSGKVKVNLNGASIDYDEVREVQVPILPIGNGSVHPNITVKVYAHDNSNYGHTYTYTNEVTSATGLLLARNEMFSAKCRMASGSHVDDFDARSTALTFEAKEAGATVTFTACTTRTINMEYSTDGGANWNAYTSGDLVTLNKVGDKVLFRGDNACLATSNAYSNFASSGECYIYGNIMSLLDKNNFATATTFTQSFTFACLFQNNTSIHNHSSKRLLLPATTLFTQCYTNMFSGCTGLTEAPELPSTTLANYCYRAMFDGCTGLTETPELPAETMVNGCYNQMFKNCTGLTTAPILPATTLAELCYAGMFTLCTNLTTPPALPVTTLAPSCYQAMFSGCTSLTTAPALPSTIMVRCCYMSMFQNCSTLTAAPALPATELNTQCYESMFKNCSSLTVAPALPATTLSYRCYYAMFYGCTGLTTAPTLPAETLGQQCYREMFYGCTGLTTAPTLPATTMVSNCYKSMFYGCTGLATAPTLPAMSVQPNCYESMFQNCTNLTTAPVLPATFLMKECYKNMFNGCTSLNSVTCLATNISESNCTLEWLNGVAATGTFTKASSMSSWTTGASGIPENWTVVDY